MDKASESSDKESDEKKLIRRAGINLKIAVTNEEEKFRKELYPDVSKIKNENLKCTVCSKTLVSAIFAKGRLFRHTVLDVLVCEDCLQFYGDGDFSTDEDGDDKYCRWCGQGGRLYCCSKCTCVFCKKCVKQNLKRGEVDHLEREDWKCFVCQPKPLFPLRAECWAVGKHLQNEEHKKAKAMSRRESYKRKHSTSSEEIPSKTKTKDQGLDSKKSKLRSRQSSDDSNDTDKRRKRRPKEDSGDSNSTDQISAKNEKLKKSSGAVNRAKSPKKKMSPASVKPKINVNKENHVSSKKSAVLVNSNNSSETKRSKDMNLKKDKRDSVDSSDGNKSKHSVKSSHSRDSSVCSESKQTKKQIKLACEFLLTTVRNVQQLGEVMANRVKTYEQKITQNELKTQDDVMKTINKLSKMLIGVHKNVGFIQEALEQNVKTWAAVMDLSNTADLSSLIFNKLEVTNEDQGMDVDELVEGSAAASENLKDTVVDEKGEDSAMQDDKADENEFPSNLDLEHVINDVIQTVTKSIEDEIENERTGTEIDNTKDTTNENGVLTENEDESRKLDDTAETDKYVAKSSEETVKEIEANENKVSENEVSDERFDKDTAEMTNDEGNCSAVDYNMESTLNESKDADKLVQNEESTTDLSSTFGNEINETSDKVTEEDVSKGVNEEEFTKILCEESEDQNKRDENIVNKENEKSNENVSDRTDGSLEPDSLEHSRTNTNEIEGEKNENLDDKETGDVSCFLEDDKAVLAELLNDSSNDTGSGSDDKKQPVSSTSSEDLLLSLSSDEDRKSRRKKKRRERKQKTDRKPKETVEDEEEKDDEEGEKSENEENGEGEENEEINDGTKQDTDSDAEITRLTDLSKLRQKRKKVYTSSEEEDESNQDSDDDLEKGKRAVAKKKKRETQKDKQEKEEGLLDFLGNSDEEAVDNDACEDIKERMASSDDSFMMHPITDKCKDLDKQQQQLALKLLLLSSDSDVDKVPAEHDSDSDISLEDESKKKKRRKRKVKSEERSDKKTDDGKDSGEGEDSSDGSKINDAKNEAKETENKSDTDEGNKIEEEGDKNKKSENEEKENVKGSNENGDTSSSDLFQKKKKSGKSNWRNDRLLRMKLSQSDTSDEERWWSKRIEKQKEKHIEDLNSSDEIEEIPVATRKVKNKIKSDSDKSDSSIILLSSSEDSSSWESEVSKAKKAKRKKPRSDSSASKASSTSSIKKKKKRRRIKSPDDETSDSESQIRSQKSTVGESPGKGGRKNIRKLLDKEDLAEATRKAAKEEEERKKRIAHRKKLFNEVFEIKESEILDKLVLDFDEESKEEIISVDSSLVKKMKPHQAKGVKFMWDSCFESIKELKTKKGSGCILAHCMGLGKTFQVVSLAHTLLTKEETGIKTILIVCPLSTVLNWYSEFDKWLKDTGSGKDVEVYHLTKWKQNYERSFQLKQWHSDGGVMIMGYDMFRILSNPKAKNIRASLRENFQKTLLDPGPDLVICDEGHMLKNENTALSKAMSQIRTLRRIVLTGTPMQNNLKEYHCMVQFVKPNLLGTRREFLNRFVNPITNGQFVDSTETDVKIMKRRAHVLHKMLEGLVQRYDYNVLTPFLPPKHEYVILLRLSEVQIRLYQYYLDHFAQGGTGARTGSTLFVDWQMLGKIWTHPRVLLMTLEKSAKHKEKEDSDSEGSLKDFVVDDSEESSSSESSDNSSKSSVVCLSNGDDNDADDDKKKSDSKKTRVTRSMVQEGGEELVEPEPPKTITSGEWWSSMIEPEQFEDINLSAKLILLFGIIKECELIEDKVLVFSQSLTSLDLIEYFLAKIDEASQKGEIAPSLGNHGGCWAKGIDYFRLDGSSSSDSRSSNIALFNSENNPRARLFLISTRAGGLGINLTAANRVVIFDASWNPSHDIQSIFRVYRFGQKKPCYIYRFIAQGTMEEKVYDRQVTKQSLSMRVVDEQQVNRHFSCNDLEELYTFSPKGKTERPVPMLPKDRLMAELLQQFGDFIETYHEHDSLLENIEGEELNEEERTAAWEDYENEKKQTLFSYTAPVAQVQGQVQGNPGFINKEMMRVSLQKQYPNVTEEDLNKMVESLMLQMQYATYRMQNQPQNLVQHQMVYNKQTLMPATAHQAPLNQVYNMQRERAFQQQFRMMTGKNMPSGQMASPAAGSGMTTQQLQSYNYLRMQQQNVALQQQFKTVAAMQQQPQRKPVMQKTFMMQQKHMATSPQQMQAAPTPLLAAAAASSSSPTAPAVASSASVSTATTGTSSTPMNET